MRLAIQDVLVCVRSDDMERRSLSKARCQPSSKSGIEHLVNVRDLV